MVIIYTYLEGISVYVLLIETEAVHFVHTLICLPLGVFLLQITLQYL